MTVPAWDFATADDRRAFIAWVNAELDRFDQLITERFDYASATADLVAAALAPIHGQQGRPTETDAHRERQGQNTELRDAALLRWMFELYWPGRRRSMTDPANAFQIAVARNRRGLRTGQRTPDRVDVVEERSARAAHSLKKAYDRSMDTPGRRIARDDIAYLSALAGHLFADHFTGDKISG